MTNPVLDAIATRYSCRSYTNEPVSRADLETLALAGVQAPSSRGGAPWYLAVITDPALIEDINTTALNLMRRHEPEGYNKVETRDTNLFFNAPALIIVASKRSHDYTPSELDAGLLVENIVLAAHSIGLGACICGYATQAFRDTRSDDPQRLSELLGFPWGYEMTVGIMVGHPDQTRAPHTPNLAPVRYFD